VDRLTSLVHAVVSGHANGSQRDHRATCAEVGQRLASEGLAAHVVWERNAADDTLHTQE